jgi:hypothetical protein
MSPTPLAISPYFPFYVVNEFMKATFCYLGRTLALLRAALHIEAGQIRCVRGLKSSLVIGQKAQIGPNPFTPRGQAELVV